MFVSENLQKHSLYKLMVTASSLDATSESGWKRIIVGLSYNVMWCKLNF